MLQCAHAFTGAHEEQRTMGKATPTTKEAKKQPALTAKEKKAAKLAKKNGLSGSPVLPRNA